MNTEVTKVLDILAVINAYPGNPFDALTTYEKLDLAVTIRRISPDMEYSDLVEYMLEIFSDIDSNITGLTTAQKMIIAAKVGVNAIGGDIVAKELVLEVDAVAASATLTIGGESDSDIATGDIINVWDIALTAVANDATPGDYEFCIDDDKDTVITNILSCISKIPGNTVFPFTAKAGDSPTITFTAKEAGAVGNTIPVSITTEGATAFDAETLTEGSDKVEPTPGRVCAVFVDEDDNVYIRTNKGYKLVTLTEG